MKKPRPSPKTEDSHFFEKAVKQTVCTQHRTRISSISIGFGVHSGRGSAEGRQGWRYITKVVLS